MNTLLHLPSWQIEHTNQEPGDCDTHDGCYRVGLNTVAVKA
jgi:hypothetical protein